MNLITRKYCTNTINRDIPAFAPILKKESSLAKKQGLKKSTRYFKNKHYSIELKNVPLGSPYFHCENISVFRSFFEDIPLEIRLSPKESERDIDLRKGTSKMIFITNSTKNENFI
ncbi:hypothetical protein [Flammeovirga pacifica]|uniref:Uncharacterized protein n=1 Tax=Flammeovirga pacifica TaxID=915059 RepID=A0A1S1YXR4_FLAPC|nr:hypothetical protein [Flammeovirga pacifica]OHX65723.1 hypothetical protein NH26_04835 [Flammeovirga pacifica]